MARSRPSGPAPARSARPPLGTGGAASEGGQFGPPAGFVGLALALIAGLRPSGIVAICLLYGALNNGAKGMVIETGIPLDLLDVVIAIALMFVAAPGLIRSIWRMRPRREPLEPAFGT